MRRYSLHREELRLCYALLGTLLMALGVNGFLVPAGLYSGGLLGLCQLLRTLLQPYMSFLPEKLDAAGCLYWLLNVPLLWLARRLGRRFFRRSLLLTALSSLLYLLLPTAPLLPGRLAGALLGGVCAGVGTGMVLTAGGSTGGLDILALWLSRYRPEWTVGRFFLAVNLLLYSLCLLLFDLETALYSLIFALISAQMTDRSHQQSIDVQVLIFTKNRDSALPQLLLQRLQRGLSYWDGVGAYTGQELRVMCLCLSKYEVEPLRQLLQQLDPEAFFITQQSIRIHGNFRHRVAE